jgi:hypothetical protein
MRNVKIEVTNLDFFVIMGALIFITGTSGLMDINFGLGVALFYLLTTIGLTIMIIAILYAYAKEEVEQ